MKNREAFDLRGVIKVYNIFQIVYNSWMFLYVSWQANMKEISFLIYIFLQTIHFLFVLRAYDLGCMNTLPLDHEHKDRERYFSNLYLINKFIDLIETVFFVLRKKDRQISVLHVFHHASMPLAVYTGLIFNGYGGIATSYCLLNVLVHILMYTYYYLSSVSEAVQKSLWWKKYITIFQMVQFAVILACISYALWQPDCTVPTLTAYLAGILAFSFLLLFSNFYVRTYVLAGPKRRD